MKRLKFLYTFLILLMIQQGMAQNYLRYVDPYIGSGGHGHVFVGASVPFGTIQVDRRIFLKVGIGVPDIIIPIVL